MLTTKKEEDPSETLLQIFTCIFEAEFKAGKFFPMLAQVSDNPDLQLPCQLIFAVYNVLIREQPETAFKCLEKINKKSQESMANIAGLVVKSAYLAYCKKYKQSIDCLKIAYRIANNSQANKQFSVLYSEVVLRMIQIHDFGAFKREYLDIIDKILNENEQSIENCQILKILIQQRQAIKEKVCLLPKKTVFGQFSSQKNSSIQNTKLRLKPSFQSNSQREKSISSSKRSFKSPSMRDSAKQFKKKKFVNPYGLAFPEEKGNSCVFM